MGYSLVSLEQATANGNFPNISVINLSPADFALNQPARILAQDHKGNMAVEIDTPVIGKLRAVIPNQQFVSLFFATAQAETEIDTTTGYQFTIKLKDTDFANGGKITFSVSGSSPWGIGLENMTSDDIWYSFSYNDTCRGHLEWAYNIIYTA